MLRFVEAGGVLGLSPAEVRACTLADFNAMVSGHMKANGVTERVRPMSRKRFNEMVEEYG